MRQFIAFAATSFSLIAQVQVTVIVRDPLPAAISAWREDPTLVRVIIISAPGTPAYPGSIVGFELRDLLTNRVLARSRNGHPHQPRIDIPAGPATLSLTGRDIVELEAIDVDRSIEAQVVATGLLPEGQYEFCIRLYDRELRPLAVTGQLCPRARVLAPDPPQLLSPADSSFLTTATPLFTWTPIQPSVGLVRYRIRIAPIYGNQDRRSALERNAPLVEQELATTSLLYSLPAPPWELYPEATGFVWQVQALTPDGRPAARNEGKSPIFLFYPPAPNYPEEPPSRQPEPPREPTPSPTAPTGEPSTQPPKPPHELAPPTSAPPETVPSSALRPPRRRRQVVRALEGNVIIQDFHDTNYDPLRRQQPPALILASVPAQGQNEVPITHILRIELGAPLAPNWSSDQDGLYRWQLRNVTAQLYELSGESPQLVSIRQILNTATLLVMPTLQLGALAPRTVLMPNTQYRLIVAGTFWIQTPDGTEALHSYARDTLHFSTGTPEGFTFDVRSSSVQGLFRDRALVFTPSDLILHPFAPTDGEWLSAPMLPLQFGRDLWLHIRDDFGRIYEWRGPRTSFIREVDSLEDQPGVRLEWDTTQLQPRFVLNGGYDLTPNSFTVVVLNAKKAGSTANRPDTATRLLEALPLEIDRWRWIRLSSPSQLQLSTQVSWASDHDNTIPPGAGIHWVVLRNTGSHPIPAGTPFWILVRELIAGTVTETRTLWHIPRTLPANDSLSIPIHTQTGAQGVSIQIVPRAPFIEQDRTDNCVDAGAGCARCQPPPECAIPTPASIE